MDALDLDAYAERLGCATPERADLSTLETLHEAHVAAIPFENLDVLLGRPVSLDPDALERKLIHARRGGYCFEQNTLFQAVLEQLGFRVTALAARVVASLVAPAGSGPAPVRARTHMLLRVDVDGSPFLADVGFGGDGLIVPLAMEPGAAVSAGDSRHRLDEAAGTWTLSAETPEGRLALYAFTLEPQLPVDFVMANHFTSTFPRSPFVRTLTAQRAWRSRRVVLCDRELVSVESGQRTVTRVKGPEHLARVLEEHFGLVLPAGTRLPKPEF